MASKLGKRITKRCRRKIKQQAYHEGFRMGVWKAIHRLVMDDTISVEEAMSVYELLIYGGEIKREAINLKK